MKLYKYRPLSELLFKELYYQEIYFASYLELNDPLDISARIEFTPESVDQIEYLLWLLFKTTFKLESLNDCERQNNDALLIFNKNEALKEKLKIEIFNKIISLKSTLNSIFIDDLEKIINQIAQNIPFKIDYAGFRLELNRLWKKFLQNSHVAYFSETKDNFLMWAHYAGKHSGICLEFNLENEKMFPYKKTGKRSANHENYLQRISKWNIDETIFWEGLRKVKYKSEQPFVNFFEFSSVFDNEDDCDLMGLSKSWTHGFAYELKNVFATKTLQWSYEHEWRAIEISFGDVIEPEKRIKHYPIECLSGIYFGIKTPDQVKNRIFKLFKNYNKKLDYYDGELLENGSLEFTDWQYYESD